MGSSRVAFDRPSFLNMFKTRAEMKIRLKTACGRLEDLKRTPPGLQKNDRASFFWQKRICVRALLVIYFSFNIHNTGQKIVFNRDLHFLKNQLLSTNQDFDAEFIVLPIF